MRLRIETDGYRLRAGGPARPKQDYQDKDKQATTPDGRPIWVVRLTRSTRTPSTDQASPSGSRWLETSPS